MVTVKSEREIELMRAAGLTTARILDAMCQMAKPGVSTWDLDHLAETMCKEAGVTPAFKGYHGFPACVCISVNDEVVHGIPSKKRVLKDGDIVGLDFGVIKDGWYGDTARSVAIGKVAPEAEKLLKITQESLLRGIAEAKPGNRVFDIGHAVQAHAEAAGFSVVREFVGHGIGRALHEDPQVPNYGPKGKGMVLKTGMVLAIEPMINAGRPDVRVLQDGWTAVTTDKSLSAHFEHTVAITENGPVILTALA
ncbi:MAG: type I methionyl aminopeptidase [Bdellovibrionales bacterium]|nr:type I methionyl aminopeptidase [Bdellovibrionales bacterium]